MTVNKGVYFLANDAIYDLAVAFLKSFRVHNPSSSLCLIPYDSDIRRLSALSGKYDFTLFEDRAVLDRCDRIAQQFHGKPCGQYRKLAAWHGPFESFVYIDTDTVVTNSVDFVHGFSDEFAFVFSHSNAPHLRQWVWKESIYSTGALSDEQIRFSANTGFFASRKGKLTLDEAEARLPSALAIVGHMVLFCVEQPFLNYLVVTSGKLYSSITNIRSTTGLMQIPVEKWAGEKIDLLRFENCRTPEENVLLVHWAGEWQPTALEVKVHSFLRKCGFRGGPPRRRWFMRNGRLWRYYRNLPDSLFANRNSG
jgi:hypothetical protein